MARSVTTDLHAKTAALLKARAGPCGRSEEDERAALVGEAWRVSSLRAEAAQRAFERLPEGLFDGPGDLADRHDEYLCAATRRLR